MTTPPRYSARTHTATTVTSAVVVAAPQIAATENVREVLVSTDQPVRVTFHGVDPGAALGHILPAEDLLRIPVELWATARLLATDADASLQVTGLTY